MIDRIFRRLRAVAAATASRLFPGRLAALVAPFMAFVAVNQAVRFGLAVYNGDLQAFGPLRLLGWLGIGLVFDVGVATFFLAPLALLLAVLKGRRLGRLVPWLIALVLLPLSLVMVFVAFAEFTFWEEFSSRFNFIAVDYLVYTNEVVGNIRESYNLPLLLSLVGVVALLVWGATVAGVFRIARRRTPGAARPIRYALVALLLAPFASYAILDARFKDFSANAQVNELAGNGYFDFWHAFWSNEIDYERFYRKLPPAIARRVLQHEFDGGGPIEAELRQLPQSRPVVAEGPEKPLNVVLISVESLSAEFLGALGDTRGLTPALDRLAADGMLFTRLYATGTRTVRGLEALTLSVPPTPGHSIVKRPDNANLYTIGEVFHERGYEPIYFYGGYGYFDNMNAFFGGNGYTVIDRTALKPDEITMQNIWGVADEDLFRLALRQLDERSQRGRKFFAHIMTVSNHRPFTYPDGRIDIPSKTGREGAVKYTDWAIGDFIREARSKPWFDDTLFVIVADHTHKGRGKTELPIANYHIPMIVYAPRHVAPARVDSIASQIDVAPTILGLLNVSYDSHFFGQDILREGRHHQRALMANYQTVGYYEHGRIVELMPRRVVRVVDALTGAAAPTDELSTYLTDKAISYYQLASDAYRSGMMRRPVVTKDAEGGTLR